MRATVVFVLIFSTGCAAGKEAAAPAYPRTPQSAAERPRDREEVLATAAFDKDMVPAKATTGGAAAPTTTTPPAPPQPAPAEERPENRDLVIYTAHYAMAVYQVEQGIAEVERIAKEQNGYLAVKKDREITIRVPRTRFEIALSNVDKIGDVLHRDVEALDVTDEHVDLEIRIRNARAVQRQLTELLGKANVKEALDIEKELARVTEELERFEGKLKLLNDKVAFSTISVSFEPRGNTLQTQRVRLPFPWLNTLNLPTLLQLGEDK